MTTAGERLVLISGLSGVSAATMMAAAGTGGTTGAALVNYSGLSSGTAAEHILVDRAPAQPSAGGGYYPRIIERRERAEVRAVTWRYEMREAICIIDGACSRFTPARPPAWHGDDQDLIDLLFINQTR